LQGSAAIRRWLTANSSNDIPGIITLSCLCHFEAFNRSFDEPV
jgi:hypothetical protein